MVEVERVMQRRYTLSIFTENQPGVLHRITVIFTRRKLNIESLTVSETETPDVSRFTIVLRCDGDTASKVAKQIGKIVDVHDVIVSEDEALVAAEVALFKMRASSAVLMQAAQQSGLRVMYADDVSCVLVAVGNEDEIGRLREKLVPLGLVEFVRSGRIALLQAGAEAQVATDRREPEPSADSWI